MIDVVIVEDEIWIARMILKIIDWEALGLRITNIYYDGNEALIGIKKHKPQLVLTDIRMPGITGLDIVSEIHESNPDIMFIIISGYNDFEYAQTALSYGALGYLLKPIDENELKKVVIKARELIEQKQMRSQSEKQMKHSINEMVEKLREKTLFNMLNGLSISAGNLNEINEELHLKFCSGRFLATILAIEETNQVKKMTEKIMRAIWRVNLPSECFEIVTLTIAKEMIIILNYRDEPGLQVEDSLIRMFDEVLSDNSDSKITMGIGLEVENIFSISKSFEYAREMHMYRLIGGSNRCYNSRVQTRSAFSDNKLFCPNFELSLKQALNSKNVDELGKLTDDAIDYLVDKAQKQYAVLMIGINRLLTLFEESAPAGLFGWADYFFNRRISIVSSNTIREIKELMREICGELISNRSTDDSETYRPLMKLALEFINQNYMHDIGLGDVSEIVQMNPNYFSVVFKHEIGVNFKEYLTNKRIDIAKELLCNTVYKLSEISDFVGYNDVKNFGKMFKKAVGVAPIEYRKLMSGHA